MSKLWVRSKGSRGAEAGAGAVAVRVVRLSKGCIAVNGAGRQGEAGVDERVDLWPFHKYRYKQITATIMTQQQQQQCN